MSANTQVLDGSGAGGMNLEGWCVLIMGALFGLFLFGVWWELRRNLRSISRQSQQRERAMARLESEAAFVRELAREAASRRVLELRSVPQQQAQVLELATREEEVPVALGLESVGRILERLAHAAPQIEDEVPAFGASLARPALNMVRGGKDAQADVTGATGEGTDQVAAARAKRGAAGRGKVREGGKSSSIGSSALVASR